jgi:hypothetical protein
VLPFRYPIFQIFEGKSSFVDRIEQPDEQDDLWFICAFDVRDLRAKSANPLDLIVPPGWLHDHQNDFKLTLAHTRPVGSGAGTGDAVVCGLGKHPSGAVIAGVDGSGGVAVSPTSSG